MTYSSSNKPVRKWKILFSLSIFLNMILIVALLVGKKTEDATEDHAKETPPEQKQELVTNTTVEQTPVEKKEPLKTSDIAAIKITLKDNFYSAFSQNEDIRKYSEIFATPNLAKLLSAHIGRILAWDLNLRKDIRKGDRISFLFRVIPTEELETRDDMPDLIEIVAVNYFSKKFSKNIEVYRYKSETEKYSKYYYADGRMIEEKLKNPPIKDYIQVTSLLNERSPRHEGVDFKAFTGTPVYASTDGVILRTNWKTRYNGYCIEVKVEGKNNTLKYLHLSDVLVKKGDSVKAGDHIANSGNTGKSTAPHLHYQINSGANGKSVDPLKFHETYYTTLEGSELDSFNEQIVEFQKLLELNENDA